MVDNLPTLCQSVKDMAKQSFAQKNFLAILAFGVMVLATFVAVTAASNPPQTTVQANGTQ